MDVTIRGGEDFFRLSKALKAAGRTELRKELNKALRDAAKPLIPVTRAAARAGGLPDAGGLSRMVAKAPQRIQVRTGAQTAGVRLVVRNNKSAARTLNRGYVRHPVFGDRDRWVTQPIPDATGWFDETLEREAPRVATPAVERAMNDVADRIVREAR